MNHAGFTQRQFSPVPCRSDPPLRAASLTEREGEILLLVAQGLSNREIAEKLVVSERTVRSHVSNILQKLHLTSRTQAALYAVKEGVGHA